MENPNKKKKKIKPWRQWERCRWRNPSGRSSRRMSRGCLPTRSPNPWCWRSRPAPTPTIPMPFWVKVEGSFYCTFFSVVLKGGKKKRKKKNPFYEEQGRRLGYWVRWGSVGALLFLVVKYARLNLETKAVRVNTKYC